MHRLFGHGVEDDAIDRLVLEQFLMREDFVDMPGDRLALAVGVGGEDDAVGHLHRGADFGKSLGGLAVDFPFHPEIVVGIHGAVLGFEIAHMAERRVNLVILSKIFIDGFRLGRRFDDDNLHARPSCCDRRIWAKPTGSTSRGVLRIIGV